MGLFSKLMAKATGSWADVSISAGDAQRGRSAALRIDVQVKDTPIVVDRIVVSVRCSEEIRIPRYRLDVHDHDRGAATSSSVDVEHAETLFEEEYIVATNVELAANEHVEYSTSVDLALEAPPSFEGLHARYVWSVHVGLEMPGNDPDSGWQEIFVL